MAHSQARFLSCCLVTSRTQIPETAHVGTVLSTLTCVDPDSAVAALDYELQFQSSPNPASLRLRDRVLEVLTPHPDPQAQGALKAGRGGWAKGLWPLRP